MVKFYFDVTPNPMAVALFLEESGLPYRVIPAAQRGPQPDAEFLGLNPAGKAPLIVDDEAAVFGGAAALLYLADKTGKFLSQDTLAARAELLSWLMFAAEAAPFAPHVDKRDLNQLQRHFAILDARLKNRRHLVSYSYTIADMSLWGWSSMAPSILGEEAWKTFPHVKRHHDDVSKRSAAARALALLDNGLSGTEEGKNPAV